MCDHLNLVEKDYFGLANWETPTSKVVHLTAEADMIMSEIIKSVQTYVPSLPQTWLDAAKEIRKHVSGAVYEFTFSVKFYPPDPAQLTEDITRSALQLVLTNDGLHD